MRMSCRGAGSFMRWLGGVRSYVQICRPFQRFAPLLSHEAVLLEQGLHTSRGVHEPPEGIPKQDATQILHPNRSPHVPPVARIGERHEASAAAQCRLKQRLVRRVAANHAIHGHDVGLHDVSSDGHEIALHHVEAIGDVTATSFLASSCNIGRRRFYSGHPLSTRGQELEAERADTGANIQNRLPVPCLENCIPQQARRLIRPVPPVPLEIAPSDSVAELELVSSEEWMAAGAHLLKTPYQVSSRSESIHALALQHPLVDQVGAEIRDVPSAN